jgi:hypothetical protein
MAPPSRSRRDCGNHEAADAVLEIQADDDDAPRLAAQRTWPVRRYFVQRYGIPRAVRAVTPRGVPTRKRIPD